MTTERANPGPYMEHFQLSEQATNGAAKVMVSGEIDLAAVLPLQELLFGTMNGPSSTTEVDLGNVSFMDASGITALIRADDKARDVGGRLHLSHVPERVFRLLRIFDLDRRFTILT
ncbi:STAS domain-containing protein [Nonomuraea angiospora]|uniref:Anti-sigma factor antagonist n=1 Tax=Nonomuraea angiospora TaxID=46172 RepID=A0ABR9LRR0_9ACTN|nr:STAS domain-containing protein [Nonomuraea angiospora]MBE1583355.1 anti-anti-sigma factor [Nonomuraea angiospora]